MGRATWTCHAVVVGLGLVSGCATEPDPPRQAVATQETFSEEPLDDAIVIKGSKNPDPVETPSPRLTTLRGYRDGQYFVVERVYDGGTVETSRSLDPPDKVARRELVATPPGRPPARSMRVRTYVRKDGTVVKEYVRSPPPGH